MKWGVELFISLVGTDPFLIVKDSTEQAPLWPGKIFFRQGRTGAADDPGAIGDNPGDNDLCPFLHDEMMSIEQGDDSIRGLLNTDDMVRVEVHLLFVQAGEKNHGPPLKNQVSTYKYQKKP